MFPLKLTDIALERLISAKNSDNLSDEFFVRVSVKGGGCSGFQNDLSFDDSIDPEDDIIESFSFGDSTIRIASDTFSAMYLKDVTLDFITSDFQEGFKFSGGTSERRHCACGSSFTE